MATLSVRVLAGGERVPFLLDENGSPLFYPTLFETSQLRNRGAAANTIRNKLAAIEVLRRWEAAEHRDLVLEFHEGDMLSVADVASLRDFAGLDMRAVEASGASRRRVARGAGLEACIRSVPPQRGVGQEQHYDRLSTIADYLEFLASVVTQRHGREDVAAVAKMAKTIRHHRPRGHSRNVVDDPTGKSPPPEIVDRFMAAMDVNSPRNPFRDPGIRLRNAIIFGLLRWTGMRRGELLSLQLDQFGLERDPIVWVRRNQDDIHDVRRYQPASKTKERPLPLPESLARQIQDYKSNVRAEIAPARLHGYLFVGHRNGKTFGQPLSLSALGSSIMARARAVDPTFALIHPHAFRHHFNDELSRRIDARNAKARKHSADELPDVVTDVQEADMRAFLNGHRSTATGRIYNQRHIKAKADRVVRQIQSALMGTSPAKDEDHETNC